MRPSEIAHLHALRSHEANHLDAGTAEIRQFLVSVNDVYGDFPPDPSDRQVLVWFARAPGNPHWIAFRDLPTHTAYLLQRRVEAQQQGERPRPLPSGGSPL